MALVAGTGHALWLVYAAEVSPRLLAELEKTLRRSKFRQYHSEEEARAYVDHLRLNASLEGDPDVPEGATPDPGSRDLCARVKSTAARSRNPASGQPPTHTNPAKRGPRCCHRRRRRRPVEGRHRTATAHEGFHGNADRGVRLCPKTGARRG